MTQDSAPPSEFDATLLVRRMGHDFNNLLSVVLGGLSLIREELDHHAWDADTQALYDDVVSAAREAADVIADLTAWAGRQALEPQQCLLNELVRDVEMTIRPELGERVSLEVRTTPGVVQAWCDPARLREALLELVANACNAVASGGTIIVGVSDSPTGVYVTDSGAGMTPEALAAAREPYFTTRQGAGHRGLGLSVVDGFARASGGQLEIGSSVEEGTRVFIQLPNRRPLQART